MNKLKVHLGKPEHGWVLVTIEHNSTKIEFHGSDVPNNPIQDLNDALYKTINGEPSEVWWHLEPAGYFFTFENSNNKVILKVLYADDFEISEAKEVMSIEGTVESILVPMWRGLKVFLSYNPIEPHWPEVPTNEIINFGEKLKNG